jgi:hypothetical protein
LLNVWNKYLCCAGNIQERSRQDYWKSRERDFVDIRHAGYVPLSHGREGRRCRIGEERRGFEDEGHKILKAGGEERELRARLSRFGISRSGRGGLASRDAYQNDGGLPSRRW